MNICTKQYQPLTDHETVWQLMVDTYVPRCENGMAAPFFEYALTASWFDTRYLYLNGCGWRGIGRLALCFMKILFHASSST